MAEIEYEGFTGEGSCARLPSRGFAKTSPRTRWKPKPCAAETSLGGTGARHDTPSHRHAAGSAPVMGVVISNAEKPLWPDAMDGFPVTKLDLARYYEAVGEWLIHHIVAGRVR